MWDLWWEVALEQILLKAPQFSPVTTIPPMLHVHISSNNTNATQCYQMTALS
jgi:hypothetical protein